MDSVGVFNVASRIETPLMLAALVVLVLFVLFRAKITDRQAKMLFVLALVAIVLGIVADLVRAKITPPVRYWIDGRVYSPPTDRTAGVPRAVVFFETHEQGVQTTCTDERGYFKFEIPSGSIGKPSQIWVVADRYHSSDVRAAPLTSYPPTQEFGILPLSVLIPNELPITTIIPSANPVPPPPPPPSAQLPSCLEGDWYDQLVGRTDEGRKPFQWHLSIEGNTVRIVRQDKFAEGSFTGSNGEWKGNLTWGNGDTWHNMVLSPSADCHTIATNQSWYYRR